MISVTKWIRDRLFGAPDGPPGGVYLVPIACEHMEHLCHVAGRLSDIAPVTIHPAPVDVGRAWIRERGQYDASTLLIDLINACPPNATVIGVTALDLCNPMLDFVFGEAQLGGRAAIVSTFRLGDVCASPLTRERLLDRLTKVTVHELGHLLGLAHCANRSCVMRASAWAVDVDTKTERFCPDCHSLLEPRPCPRWQHGLLREGYRPV